MKRFVIAAVAALLFSAGTVFAVGTVTTTTTNVRSGDSPLRTTYSLAWTSTAGGAVSGNAVTIRPGKLLSVRFIPASGGTQPTDLYDVTLVDSDGVDVLAGGGANLSNAAASIQQWDPPMFHDGTRTLDLVIANAGASKTGTVVISVE